MQNTLARLKVLINSSTPLVIMETLEEARALGMVRQAAGELQLPVFEWSIAEGLVRTGGRAEPGQQQGETRQGRVNREMAKAGLPLVQFSGGEGRSENSNSIYNTREPEQALAHIATAEIEACYVLKDFHRFMDNTVVIRRLRQVAQQFAGDRRTVIITAPAVNLPPELESQAEYLDLPLPDPERLIEIVEQSFARLGKKHTLKRNLDAAGLEQMAGNLRGLTELEAERAVAQGIMTRKGLDSHVVTDVLEAKKEILRRSDMLQFIEVKEPLDSIGGLENLKIWLRKRSGAWSDNARQFGLEPPKGVIIMGVQGCGKSMCARAVAAEWKLPLVKFETSMVYDKYVGESEKRIQKVFKVAEQLAPCVLWIDEMEKVFAGSAPDSASADSGVSARLLGSFLSWMQERKSAVFVAATSNNVNVLPPELIRKGRFDELFFVDLPNAVERHAILAVQLRRRKLEPVRFDLKALVDASQGFSGAEIDAALQSSLYAAFSEQTPISTETVLLQLRSTRPLSLTRAEDIARLRAWAAERAVPASRTEASTAAH